ncbi:RNase P subunit p30 family protein [Nanoarchaeota archaeon]
MIDIAFPNKNEEEFISVAEKLGSKGICFIYKELPKKVVHSIKRSKLLSSSASSSSRGVAPSGDAEPSIPEDRVLKMPCTNYKNLQKLSSKTVQVFVGSLSRNTKSLLVLAKNPGEERELIEKHKPDIIFGMESSEQGDFMHQRNSGLNQVLCKLALSKKVMFGVDFNAILSSNTRKRAELIGRTKQNIKLFRKFGNEVVLASFAQNPYELRSSQDLKSFGIMLGMTSTEAKKALENIEKRIILNQKKISGEFLGEGIEKS